MKKRKITEMNRLEMEDYKQSSKTPLVVVLDNVRSMNNVGSIFRTADAFRLEAIYLCGITSHPPHPDIHKTALGAEDCVSWYASKDAVSVVESLQREGFEVYALEQAHGSHWLSDFVPSADKKYALVLGNEVKGVEQEVVDACSGCIEIPQYGTKHSLNVSVAAGVAIWHMVAPFLPNLDT